jgi:toxin ParE1/3/4
MKRFRVSRAAKKDLDEIWLYIARDSIDSATHFVEFLTEKFPLLASSPKMGRLREDLQKDLRSFPVKNYLIYYRPLGKSRVAIVRIVNAARNQKSLFANEEPKR